MTATRFAVLDLPEANAMRAPGEATGHMSLEVAMDEMAEKLGLDPVAFRIRNDTQVVPDRATAPSGDDPQAKKPEGAENNAKAPGHPFSQRQLVECLRTGADRFGWSKRNPRPAQARDGRWLVGMGVAAAYRGAPVTKSAARVRIDSRGIVTVETDMTDIGTGSYTIIAQTAAEMMGVPMSSVVVRLGDSSFPVSAGSGGQWGAASSTAGVYAACVKLREAVAQKLGMNSADAAFADGQVRSARPQRLAGRGSWFGGHRRRGPDRVRRPRRRRPSSPPSAPTSWRSASMPSRPRSACAACSPSAPPAGS